MYNSLPILNIQCYLTALVVLISLIGDYSVLHCKLHLHQALFDNATHAAVGGLSWLIVTITNNTSYSVRAVAEVIFCTVIASLIDVDHFLAARSFKLKDAVNLSQRPLLHCSTFPLTFCVASFMISNVMNSKYLQNITLLVFIAFASHHTRDAIRHGYWFYPFGSTPSIPYVIYLIMTALLPYAICYIQRYFKTIDVNKNSFVHVI